MRKIGVMVLLCLCGLRAVAAAPANPALQLLLQHLHQASHVTTPFQIEYQFVTDIQALGATKKQQVAVKHVQKTDESYLLVDGDRPTKVLFKSRSLCTKDEGEWMCRLLPPEQFEKNLRSNNMSLYPPTAMHLVETLLTTYPQAVTVSAVSPRKVAGRTCDAFHVAIDTATIDPKKLEQYIYLSGLDARMRAYITGTSLSLCFDRDTNHMLEYRNELVLNQEQMHRDGFGEDTKALAEQPVGTIRGGFLAERVN